MGVSALAATSVDASIRVDCKREKRWPAEPPQGDHAFAITSADLVKAAAPANIIPMAADVKVVAFSEPILPSAP